MNKNRFKQAENGKEYQVEIEVADGLQDIAHDELIEKLRPGIKDVYIEDDGICFTYSGDLADLAQISSATAAYLRLEYAIPRPKALLGHEHFHRLLDAIQVVRTIDRDAVYDSLHISAAGSGSSVMKRIKSELSQHTGLAVDNEAGDLLIRIRRTRKHWDVMIRLTPRPLATRDWRICDMEGALNGPVAYVMSRLTRQRPDDVVVNPMCGSGTLMIERMQVAPASAIYGLDLNDTALTCAARNIQALGQPAGFIHLIRADVGNMPFEDGTTNVFLADLPFGQLVGSSKQNEILYPSLLNEAARVATPDAIFVLITHQVRLMESTITNNADWHAQHVRKVSLRGLHPRIFVLHKSV